MNIVLTEAALDEVVQAYLAADSFVFDVETWGKDRGNPHLNQVLWIALATGDRVDVIPMGHPNGDYLRTEYPLLASGITRREKGLELRPHDYSRDEKKATKVFSAPPEQLSPATVFSALKPLFFSDKLKIGHNVKFDIESTAKYYGDFASPHYACTLVASFILDNRYRNNLGLKDCLKREFDHDMVKGVGKEVEAYSFDEVAMYAAEDARWTWKLWKKLEERLEADGLTKIFALEMDVLEVLCAMELRGADIDEAAIEKLKADLEEQIEHAKGEVWAGAGRVFNINSIAEKQQILYGPKDQGGKGLKGKVLTPKGQAKDAAGEELTIRDFAVSEPALAKLKGDRMVNALLEYSDLNKLLTTYVVPYGGGEITRTTNGKEKIVEKKSMLIDGRLHTDFVQYGAETGRFSSRNPNLQNVPAPHTANGKAIRNLFVPPEGHQLVVADYSQIEPRVIASFSNDRIMVKNYLDGGDIYTTVGDTLGVDRKAGKVLVLSMAYGVGPDKIAESIGCKVSEARALLESFEKRFPSVGRYKRRVISDCRRRSPEPYAETYLKRRRYIPELRSKDQWERARAERQAFNTVIQGSAADLIKLAMVRAYHMIPEEASLILTVHDELVTVTPKHLAEETAEGIRKAMEGIKALSIPMIADVKIVDRWGDAK
jgi:DNA polymerase I-like protein with 3'-5' exonuclease and polymerase domains